MSQFETNGVLRKAKLFLTLEIKPGTRALKLRKLATQPLVVFAVID